MLTIRLQRAGKKNRPEYRVILADKTAAAQKKFTEILGSYNPHNKVLTIRDQARLSYWMDDQHVELSATVRNLLITKEIIKGDKEKAFTIPKKEVVVEEVKEEAPTETPAEESAPETALEAEAPTEVETPAVEEAPATEPAVEPAPETPTEAPAETPVPTEEPQA